MPEEGKLVYQELERVAQVIYEMTSQLNTAIIRAAGIGLEIRVEQDIHRVIGQPDCPYLIAKVSLEL